MTALLAKHRSSRFPVLLMSLAALLVLAVVLLVRLPEAAVTRSPLTVKPSISLSLESDMAQRIQTLESELHDPEPLFLPTKWNSALSVVPEKGLQRPGESFGKIAPKFLFSAGGLPLNLPAPISIPESPAKELDHMGSDRPFIGLATHELEISPVPPRRFCVDVKNLSNGRKLGTFPLLGAAQAFGCLWQPPQFLISVNEFGLIASPGLLTSSGVDRVDEALCSLVLKEWASIARAVRIAPGTYCITVGP